MTRLYSGGGVGLEYPEMSVHVASDRMNRDTETLRRYRPLCCWTFVFMALSNRKTLGQCLWWLCVIT